MYQLLLITIFKNQKKKKNVCNINLINCILSAEINSETESQTGNSGSEDNTAKESGKSNSLTNGPTTLRNPLASAKRASSTKKVKNR